MKAKNAGRRESEEEEVLKLEKQIKRKLKLR